MLRKFIVLLPLILLGCSQSTPKASFLPYTQSRLEAQIADQRMDLRQYRRTHRIDALTKQYSTEFFALTEIQCDLDDAKSNCEVADANLKTLRSAKTTDPVPSDLDPQTASAPEDTDPQFQQLQALKLNWKIQHDAQPQNQSSVSNQQYEARVAELDSQIAARHTQLLAENHARLLDNATAAASDAKARYENVAAQYTAKKQKLDPIEQQLAAYHAMEKALQKSTEQLNAMKTKELAVVSNGN